MTRFLYMHISVMLPLQTRLMDLIAPSRHQTLYPLNLYFRHFWVIQVERSERQLSIVCGHLVRDIELLLFWCFILFFFRLFVSPLSFANSGIGTCRFRNTVAASACAPISSRKYCCLSVVIEYEFNKGSPIEPFQRSAVPEGHRWVPWFRQFNQRFDAPRCFGMGSNLYTLLGHCDDPNSQF